MSSPLSLLSSFHSLFLLLTHHKYLFISLRRHTFPPPLTCSHGERERERAPLCDPAAGASLSQVPQCLSWRRHRSYQIQRDQGIQRTQQQCGDRDNAAASERPKTLQQRRGRCSGLISRERRLCAGGAAPASAFRAAQRAGPFVRACHWPAVSAIAVG